MHNAEYKRCLETLDVQGIQRLWRHTDPHLEQLNEKDTLAAMHYARTISETIRLRLRYYSHSWLRDHDMPSGLPDNLKPKAERIYPKIVKSVGIAVGKPFERQTGLNKAVQKVMEDAVLETYADGHQDEPEIVKARMMEMRQRFKIQS